MQGNFNAIGILITFFITFILLVKFREKGITFKKTLKAILFFIFVSFLNIMTSVHLCDAGNPFTQWLIPALCIAIIFVAVENKKICRTTLFLLTIFSIILSQHFVSLVHSPQYSGNPDPKINHIVKHILKSQKESLKTAAEGNTKNYSPGWLEDSLKDIEGADDIIIKGLHKKIETYKLWHTGFTGLYGTIHKEIGIWYPGGTLKEAAKKIVIKEKI